MLNFKKKTAAIALGAALSVTTLLGGVMLNKSAITASADENDVMTASAEHNVTAPSVTTIKHNCVGVYSVTQKDVDGSTLYFKQSVGSQYDSLTVSCSYGSTYNFIAIPSTTSTTCTPSSTVVRTYCPQYKSYSAYTSLISGGLAESTYYATGSLSTGKVISTSYTSWSNTAGKNSIYRYSIAYNGTIVDGKITPSFWGKTNTESIDGINFTIYANKSSIQIKADSEVTCNSYDTMFAFYFEE